jgi:2-phospho-L-lactate/phosphoenolpyruvate guanylyltransferase
MLTLPGDIPLVSPSDVEHLLKSHREIPGFIIVPARDERGSNAIVCSPADLVPLRFGADSFFPHLVAARERGVNPNTVYLPRIALDIDEPEDVAEFMKIRSATRARALLGGGRLGAVCRSAIAGDRVLS